jgi:PilZ domain
MQNNQNQLSRPSGALASSDAEGPASVKEERRKTERRLNTRYAVSASLEAVELQSKARFTGRVSDLSLGGCYVDSITALPKDATLKIRLTHDGKFFETKARVIASSAGMGMSLMFTETESEQLQTLEGWIRVLSGELLPSEAELPEIRSQQLAEPDSKIAQLDVLNELVIELMRTGVLSDLKGREILKKTSRH